MVKDFVIGVEGLGFDSRAGQIGHFCPQRLLATAAMFLRSYVDRALSRGDGPATRYTLWRTAASIMKIRQFFARIMVSFTQHLFHWKLEMPRRQLLSLIGVKSLKIMVCQRHSLEVPFAGFKSCLMGSIYCWTHRI